MAMRHLLCIGFIISVVLGDGTAWSAPLPRDSAGLKPLFPAARDGGFVVENPESDVRLPPSTPPLSFRAVRFEPTPDQPNSSNAQWCGVASERADFTHQAIIAVGTGRTAGRRCESLLEAGPVPSALVPRLALLYRTSAPNAPDRRTAVILLWDAESGQWFIDDALGAAIEARLQPLSLARIRTELGRQLR